MKNKLPVLIFFLTIFFLSLLIPTDDYDVFFHIKSGEIFLQKGLIYHDVFSYRTEGRLWYPYEWLFQVAVYILEKNFGFSAIKIFVALINTATIFFLYKILRQIFSVPKILSMVSSLFFLASVTLLTNFIVPRPHLLAYLFLVINLYLVLLFLLKNKNLLIFSLPITLLWSNLHGSMFLSVYLFAAYTVIASIAKQSRPRILFLFTILNLLATILPPLGTLQYRLLLLFFEKQQVLSQFIDEWMPLSAMPTDLRFFKICLFITATLFIIFVIKNKKINRILWTLPLIPFLITPFLAIRNVFLAYISLSLFFGFILSELSNKKIIIFCLVPIFGFYIFFFSGNPQQDKIYVPYGAAQFIKNQNFKGNIYHNFVFGGYLFYSLYPNQKVFIDSRMDLYLNDEIPDLVSLSHEKNKPDEEYKPALAKFFDKYNFSFALLSLKKNTNQRRIASILNNDPRWKLVFWDDDFAIFVKDNGLNDEIIKKFTASSVIPFGYQLYKEGKAVQAEQEYQNMLSVADSSRSRNAIGFFLMRKGRLEEAKSEFNKAIKLNPNYDAPYMNLAELAINDNNIQMAVNLYQKAISLDPQRGFSYIRLEEIKKKYLNKN